MLKRVNIDEAERILADVKPEYSFWVNNGPILRNLNELLNSLKFMKDETFSHHVNKEKNDFANWIRDIVKDLELAKQVAKINSRKKIIEILGNRIKTLEKLQDEKIN